MSDELLAASRVLNGTPDGDARGSRALAATAVAFVVVGALMLVALYVGVEGKDLDEAYSLAQETQAFLEANCQKYDRYENGNLAKSQQSLYDAATGLVKFIGNDQVTDSEFLDRFIRSEHIGGIVVADTTGALIAQADMDDCDAYGMWSGIFQKSAVRNIAQNPGKSYASCEVVNDTPYDYVVVNYNGGYLLCYTSAAKPNTDPFDYTVSDIAASVTFEENPTILVEHSGKIVSSNNDSLAGKDASDFVCSSGGVQWDEGKLTRLADDSGIWYGARSAYGRYTIYILYPAAEVFANRAGVMANGLVAYLVVCMAILIIRRMVERRNVANMQEQLQTINAISQSYNSTLLIDVNAMGLRPIRASKILSKIYEIHPEPHDFLECAVQRYVAPDDREALEEFFDVDDLADRLASAAYVEKEIKGLGDTWYSVMATPQKRDKQGNIAAIVVATRDITAMKRAQELSYKDKLTGLHNRNYLESRMDDIARSDDYPVTLVMGDCNYLKRTNDTLGHEFGDKLLRGVAGAIRDGLPEHCIAMRVGGDEFLIVCPHTAQDGAKRIIAGIKRRLNERSDDTLHLSVSFGSYTYAEGECTFKQAYQRADEAMYENKRVSREA